MIFPIGFHRRRTFRHYGKVQQVNKKERLKTKGWGPFQYKWYSICSTHYYHDESCVRCKTGGWVNHWKWCVESVIYKLFPGLWRWWANIRK